MTRARTSGLSDNELPVGLSEGELFTAASKRLELSASLGGGSAKLRTTAKALSRLSFKGSKEVILELPKNVASGLLRGSLKRTGGVIRDTEGQIVLHLRDVSKLKKALKGVALPLMLLDFAEGALLNQKLQQIQQQVSLLAEKVEAAQKATLLLPFEKVAKLGHVTSALSREREVADAQNAIDVALGLSRQRLNAIFVRLEPLYQRFDRSNFAKVRFKRKHRGEIFGAIEEVLPETDVAIALLLLRGRLYEQQEELQAARKAYELATELAVEMNERIAPMLAPNSSLLLSRSLNPFVKTLSRLDTAHQNAKRLRRRLRSVIHQPLVPLLLQAA